MAENGIDVEESGGVEEHVVMTPKSKTSNCTVIAFDRRKIEVDESLAKTNGQVHVAGGNNKGFIVNKQLQNEPDDIPSQISLEFKVFLVNASTGMHTLESRKLRFWFKDSFHVNEQPKLAQEFFKELVSPDDFPRDYVGFLMRIMKLLKNRFPGLRKVEIEMRQLEETDIPPERPISADESGKVQVTEPKILEMIESAYPNPMTVRDMAKQVNNHEEDIQPFLEVLQEKGLIKTLDNNAYTRVVQNEMHVKIVKQMPKMIKAKQPTIAIITAQFCEKLAVDAMIENQETFVRYTTVGESNVYTLGNMGAHRVVSTKLPSVGHTREAMIAAGNTTTRLLGTFQKVDFVFLIGVGGGVPHFTDYNRHVRLGDIVVSCPTAAQKFVYLYCDKAIERPSGGLEFETRGWVPQDFVLQEIASQIADEGDEEWAHYMDEGMRALEEQEADFSRPPASSDKLYMAIGEKDIIEVAHPTPPTNREKSPIMESRVHLGPIAAGRQVARDDHIRQELASRLGIFAYDSEFDSVLESVLGNRRDSFIVIRGIADYKDGTRRRDWQPHSALLASAFAKAIISRMEPPADE